MHRGFCALESRSFDAHQDSRRSVSLDAYVMLFLQYSPPRPRSPLIRSPFLKPRLSACLRLPPFPLVSDQIEISKMSSPPPVTTFKSSPLNQAVASSPLNLQVFSASSDVALIFSVSISLLHTHLLLSDDSEYTVRINQKRDMSENEHVAGSDNDDTRFARVQIDDPYIDLEKVIEEESRKVESIEIHVGKEFKSPDEAYGFYNLYALVKGFSIRRNQRETSRNGLSGLKFVCSKQGLSQRQKHKGKPADNSSKPKTPEKERSSTRTECKAYMRCKLVDGGIWQVSRFHDEHNHQLASNSPSKLRNLRSHRCLTMQDIEIIRSLSDQNVGPSKIAEYLAQLHGGKRRALFRPKDVSNVIATDNKKLIGVDIDRTLLFFQRKQADDPEFFYSIDADEDGFVKHIFWADGRARRAYLEFGDVVTFDTTYNTNKYSMPLAPFIGVNHHRQSIFFGMALVRSENTENFCWLFETWLKAMYEFSVFKELLKDSCLGIVKEIERDEIYEVEIKNNPDFKHWVPVSYLVKVDKEAELYSCNCKGFEFDGLLCPHAMKVMWIHGIQHLPSHYILKRWCRDANANVKRPMNERSKDAGNSLALQMFRATTLKAQFSHLVDLASKDAKSFNLVEGKLSELINKLEPLQLEDMSKKPECRASNEEPVMVMTVDEEEDVPENSVVLRDPPISRCKGRKKRPLRWKPAVEKAPIKGRTCSYCGIMAKHNIRTCPKKLEDKERGKKEVQMDDEEMDDEEEDDEEEYE
ncbi:hypothetical protein LUZ63_005309 [Rhynchospora breviuscula]|uniref:SWIM-type domain-containing protein n=1 Tax=Rhynchospora breviuscula TaxID=2022672 RepID=A0A9Q0CMN4_9POAL|nr:hypothetical protein LUZ63_005309 [Rhynchospora breviuscula]